MPSPFPGMDPFIEGQAWPDFHVLLISEMRRALSPLVRPRYLVRAEEHVFVRRESEGQRSRIRPDAVVVERPSGPGRTYRGPTSASTTLQPPVTLALPLIDFEEQAFLELREAATGRVVTVIEVLSPINKQSREGQEEYLAKRAVIVRSSVHLIELDLLRGGARLPMAAPLPPADYYALVSRAERRPDCDVWPISVREPLPVVPVPLADGDPDVPLDLQDVFTKVYDAAEYAYTLDYRQKPTPPLPPEDEAWARELAAGRARSTD